MASIQNGFENGGCTALESLISKLQQQEKEALSKKQNGRARKYRNIINHVMEHPDMVYSKDLSDVFKKRSYRHLLAH